MMVYWMYISGLLSLEGVDEMKFGDLLTVVIIVGFVCIFGYIMISSVVENACREGTVTDKYILPNFKGNPKYYLVLDDEFDKAVSERDYYKHEVGDYFDPCGDT